VPLPVGDWAASVCQLCHNGSVQVELFIIAAESSVRFRSRSIILVVLVVLVVVLVVVELQVAVELHMRTAT
jgi:hypothetical protein